MKLTKLTAQDFKAMVLAGGDRLSKNVDLINSLNVFPVPDGDTGTNMNMSYRLGAEKISESNSSHVGELSAVFAKGLLMGARGNSGVILSQVFRGFSKAISDYDELDAQGFVEAFGGGVESAYKAVMKPVEGTILTVAREAALMGERKARESDDIIEIMRAIVKGASVSLEHTPNLLPVLKQVGVVDSGGKGLLCIYEGFLSSLTGEVVITQDQSTQSLDHVHAIFGENNEEAMSLDEITYGYCTEIMVKIGLGDQEHEQFDYEAFRNTLDGFGDSLLVVADEEIIKVHVHTEDPGKVMQLGQAYGELVKIKVDNMREQVRELETNDKALQANKSVKAQQKYALITVAAGEGVTELFASIGIDIILAGGQTMNPSTQDFVEAIESLNAENYILMPNNKNIIMAAEQACEVVDKQVVVIPTLSIPQAISAVVGFDSEASLEENQAVMTELSQEVVTGQITYAIRDTEIDDVVIKKDDYMGIVDGKIILAKPEKEHVLFDTLGRMINEESEIVTIFIGEDGENELADKAVERFSETYPDLEFEVVQGDQPVYDFIMSVE